MKALFCDFKFWFFLSVLVLLAFSFFAFIKNREKRRNFKTMAVLFMLGLYFANVIFISSVIYFGNKKKIMDKKEIVDSSEFYIKDENRRFRESIIYGLIY